MAKRKSDLSNVASLNQADTLGQAVARLEAILPDPGQPRRLLPDDLIIAVTQGSLSPTAAMEEWLRRAEAETVEVALRQNVRELKRLADSIAQHGLISPISVRLPGSDETVPPGITYLIVTGERRYWAHVYLLSQGRQIQAGQTVTNPDEIKVTLAPPGISIRAYQLIENLLREDLNAIERAQGMWALRYELSGVNYSSPPSTQVEAEDNSSPPSSETEVNYSSPQLVPWARVEEALGISKRYRIFVTSVLNLSEDAQSLVAGYNLAEMTIRPITQKLKNKPDLQLKALEQLIEWQNSEEEESPGQPIVASIKEFVDKLLIDELVQTETQTPEPAAPKRSRSVSSAPVIRFRDKVRETLDFLNRLKKTDRVELARALQRGDYADVMIDLRILREQIDAILSTASESAELTMTPPLLSPPTSDETASTEPDPSEN
ncbi:MAG: hypothetical protein DPW09_16755 [Anaerolineae bacterium]|nr:ParB N-terminal domain-containing protein [Anaerolineales bacterium]MCQ3975092.1 hypothetical protein [Anaerolineae bacterium]